MTRTVGALFADPPEQYGLRGDRGLWLELRVRLGFVPLPDTLDEVRRVLETAVAEAVGVPLGGDEAEPYVARFDFGGMSSGHVDLATWRKRLIPLLLSRLSEASARVGAHPARHDACDAAFRLVRGRDGAVGVLVRSECVAGLYVETGFAGWDSYQAGAEDGWPSDHSDRGSDETGWLLHGPDEPEPREVTWRTHPGGAIVWRVLFDGRQGYWLFGAGGSLVGGMDGPSAAVLRDIRADWEKRLVASSAARRVPTSPA